MRILLLGKDGQVGSELQRTLAPLGELVARDIGELDLSRAKLIGEAVRSVQPDIIINPAAYTAVDRAESEPDLAHAVNAEAPGVLAEEAQRLGAVLIHFSTDYVFDGAKGAPYTEDDVPNPINTYGRTKLEGEREVQQAGGPHLILRTSWVYSLRFDSFPVKVLRWARKQQVMRIVEDQVSCPTWSRMLAEITALLLAKAGTDMVTWLGERSGVYHLAGEGNASRLEWAKAVLRFDPRREEQIVREVQPIRSVEFPTPARRPAFSALNCGRFRSVFGIELPGWEATLQLAMEEI